MSRPTGIVCMAVAIALCSTVSRAEPWVFTGPDGGLWSSPRNWSPAGVPGDAADVILNDDPESSVEALLDIDDVIRSLTIDVGDALTILAGGRLELLAGTLHNDGTIVATDADIVFTSADDGTISGTGELTCIDTVIFSGECEIRNGAGHTIRGVAKLAPTQPDFGPPEYAVKNWGTMIADAPETFLVGLNNGFANLGLIHVYAGRTFKIDGSANFNNNPGTIITEEGGVFQLDSQVFISEGTMVIDGTLMQDCCSESMWVPAGEVRGNGMVVGHLRLAPFLTGSDPVLAPGGSPGVLTIVSGEYEQDAIGTLAIEIGQVEPGGLQHDQLVVADHPATLGGTLAVSVIDDATLPPPGEPLVIVDAPQGRLGTFDTVESEIPIDVIYTPTTVEIVLMSPADLDGDGAVGAGDLAILLAAWGPCDPDCPEDLNGDDVVNAADLAILLAAWG